MPDITTTWRKTRHVGAAGATTTITTTWKKQKTSGVPSDIIEPTQRMTFTEVYSSALSSLKRISFGLYWPETGKIVWWKGGTGGAELVHSTDGVAWTLTPFGTQDAQSTTLGYRMAVVGGNLYAVAGGLNTTDPQVWVTADAVSFTQVGANLFNSAQSVHPLLCRTYGDSTLYAVTSGYTGVNNKLFVWNGAAWVEKTSPSGTTAAISYFAPVFGGTLDTVAAVVSGVGVRLYNRTTDTWSTLTAAELKSLAYWSAAGRTVGYLGTAGNGLLELFSTPATSLLIPREQFNSLTGSADATEIGSRTYLPFEGTFNNVSGIHLFRVDAAGIASAYLGGAGVSFANDTSHVVYHPPTGRFYIAFLDLTNGLQKIYQSSAPV